MLNLPAGPLASYLIIKTSNRTVAGIGVILIFISNLALAYSTNLTMMIVLHSIPASIGRILWNCVISTAVRFNVRHRAKLSYRSKILKNRKIFASVIFVFSTVRKFCKNIFLHLLQLLDRQSIKRRKTCLFNFCKWLKTLKIAQISWTKIVLQ